MRRIETARRPSVTITFEGRQVEASEGDSVAAALLEAGVRALRETPVTGSARGPYCLMGVCFDCLVEIDGEPNRQACMVPVRPGMKVARQQGAAAPALPPERDGGKAP